MLRISLRGKQIQNLDLRSFAESETKPWSEHEVFYFMGLEIRN